MSVTPLYEKPSVLRLQTGTMNKYGSKPSWSREPRTEIDEVSIDGLCEAHGSPLFVFSERTIRKTIRDANSAFKTRYPNVRFAWSYKTNYLDAICAIFHQEGSLAEVVSEMEYERACRLGVAGEDIIFNGPNKSKTALRKAIENNSMIHVDHFDEIDDLEDLAAELDITINVAIRINLDSGIAPQWSRFGFNLESGQAQDAANRIHMSGRLRIHGLHCHVGTYILDPAAYQTQVNKLVAFGYQLEEQFGFYIQYYDLGGGFASRSRLKGTAVPPDMLVPGIEQYAQQITDAMQAALKPGHFPQIYLESGRAMIDEAGYLITTNKASKRLPDGRKAYVLDAGVNLLYTSTWYRYNIELDREVRGKEEPSILNGPLCMNIDVIDEGTILPPMPRGTRLTLSPVGAYNVTQWMQFIEYRPAIVLITEQGGVEVIRERENLNDMTRLESVPAHLHLKETTISSDEGYLKAVV